MNWLNNQRLRNAIFGALGGFTGAILAEILSPEMRNTGSNPLGLMLAVARWGMWCGLGIGAGLGLAAAPFNVEAIKSILRNVGLGALLGFASGFIGSFIAQGFYSAIGGGSFLPRAIGWLIFGVLIGAAQGISRQSIRGSLNAAMGGAIGGFIGGMCFDVIALLGDVFSRLFGLAVMGFFIGLLIAVFQAALASGILKVLSGRLEGREFYLDKSRNTLGLSAACDIGLLGDQAISMQHGMLQASAAGHTLILAPGASALVNGLMHQGNAIMLNPEDRLVIGNTKLVYRRRGSSVPSGMTVRPPSGAGIPTVLPPTSAVRKICRECGSSLASGAKFCGKCGVRTP